MREQSWLEANKIHLMGSIGAVRDALERHTAAGTVGPSVVSVSPAASQAAPQTLSLSHEEGSGPCALEILSAIFNLTPFERKVLLLCAGMELDSTIAGCCARAHNDARRSYPTFGLALAALTGAHWSALTPGAPLRRWRLIEVGTGETLTTSPLRIDERILHYLAGVQELDERLAGIIEPYDGCADLVRSQQTIAEQINREWSRDNGSRERAAILLSGEDADAKIPIAAAACYSLGLNLCLLHTSAIPAHAAELEALIRLWEREAVLGNCSLLVDVEELDTGDTMRWNAVTRLAERTGSGLFICCRERFRALQRAMIVLEVKRPSSDEQRQLWQKVLRSSSVQMNGTVDLLVSQFNLGSRAIRRAAADLLVRLDANEESQMSPAGKKSKDMLWEICREQAHQHQQGDLAQQIRSRAGWEDLVLPALQKQTLRETAIHVRQRMKVYETWGFGEKSSRGLGICALFAGPSGTGKTLAAEVLANELRLDLYRIDLSQIVSKYIGETEKNLRRIFDSAEHGGAILLFDEADALFGKRSEVKDSHDRYANIEVSYLLQRMEAYRGLAILTTNMKGALDPAFLRRIRFIVQFPFPDATQRAEIWRRVFPAATPVRGLDVTKLARLNVTGGTIRNIAVNASFLAADAGDAVGMPDVLRAARGEYQKLEKTLSETEIGGWE